MIELQENDLIKVKVKKYNENFLSIIKQKNSYNERYLTNVGLEFNHDFVDDDNKYEIIEAWRYDNSTGNFLKIYDKIIEECAAEDPLYVKSVNDEEKTSVKPADAPYDKYVALEHENAELRNIIVEQSKKLYGKNNQIH